MSASRVCLPGGVFNNESYTIDCIDCGPLEPPINGFLEIEDTVFDSEALYGCDEGYDLIGEETRNCTIDGTWTGEDPVCQSINTNNTIV